MATIKSIQVGSVVTEGDPNSRDVRTRQWTTGFYKQPVEGSVRLSRLGLDGDAVADKRFHGGPDKAVLCYAAENYASWQSEYPDLDFSEGGFGENLTVERLTEADVFIGDTYQIGDCRVQVSQPRQPCWKISRRWGEKSLTKQVASTGRTGWYLRVVVEGSLRQGDAFELLDRPNPEWSVSNANDVLFGRDHLPESKQALLLLPELADAWKSNLG